MKFSFFCTSCGAKLQLDETYRGQTVLCPGCNKEVVAPEATPTDLADGAMVSPAPDLSNRYESSGSQADGSQNNSVNNFGMVPIRVTTSELLTTTVKLLTRYPKEFLCCGAVFALLTAFMHLVFSMTVIPFAVMARGGGSEVVAIGSFGAVGGTFLFISIISLILSVMFFNYTIHLLRTGDSSTTNLLPKKTWAYWGTFLGSVVFFLLVIGIYLVALVCMTVIWGGGATLFSRLHEQIGETSFPFLMVGSLAVGLLLTIVIVYKSIMALFQYAFYAPFIIDKDVSVLKAFEYSRKFAQGNFTSFFLVFLVCQVIANCFRIPFVILGIITTGGFSEVVPAMGASFGFAQILSNTAFTFVATPLLMALAVAFYFLTTNQPTIFRGQLSRFYDSQ